MHFSGSSQNGSGSQRQAGPGGEKFCGVRNEGRRQSDISKWIHQCLFDLGVRKDDAVAMLHLQFYSTKLLAIATCKTDTAT